MKFSTAALGFILTFNGVLAAPIKERAIEVVTIVQTVTEVFYTTSVVYVPTETSASVSSVAIHETPSAVAQLVAVTPTPYPYYNPSASPSDSPTFFPSSAEPTSALPTPLSPISIPSTTIPIPVSTILPTPTPIVVPTPTSIVVSTPTPIVVPTPTPTPIVVPTPTSIVVPTATYAPPVATSAAPVAPQALTTIGTATFYDVGEGSCGTQSIPTDYIVAVSYLFMAATYNANPNKNIQCGKKIRCQQVITPANPNPPVITVIVVDTCPGCDENHLDLSAGAYEALGCIKSDGVCRITWNFI